MTPRQQKLLWVIINEFINSAEAVGSVSLSNKYKLGISPATIRNEMSILVDQGYLIKEHSSAGRIPSNMGFKHFINSIMNELNEFEEESRLRLYEEIFQNRFNIDSLIYQVVELLSEKSKSLALALIDNRLYFSGLSNLVKLKEFRNLDSLQNLLFLIEKPENLRKVFSMYKGNEKIKILIGEDCGTNSINCVAFIFSQIKLHGNNKGYLAIIGPNRINYVKILPFFRFITDTVNKVVFGW